MINDLLWQDGQLPQCGAVFGPIHGVLAGVKMEDVAVDDHSIIFN